MNNSVIHILRLYESNSNPMCDKTLCCDTIDPYTPLCNSRIELKDSIWKSSICHICAEVEERLELLEMEAIKPDQEEVRTKLFNNKSHISFDDLKNEAWLAFQLCACQNGQCNVENGTELLILKKQFDTYWKTRLKELFHD